jgi:hypothetical protein
MTIAGLLAAFFREGTLIAVNVKGGLFDGLNVLFCGR